MSSARNNLTLARSVWLGGAGAMLVSVLWSTSISQGAGGGARHLWHSHTPWLLTYTDQGPPPPVTPALWAKFMRLVTAYEAQNAGENGDNPVSFAVWIVMNGVTDPMEQWCLMWLWWSWNHQSAVD